METWINTECGGLLMAGSLKIYCLGMGSRPISLLVR